MVVSVQIPKAATQFLLCTVIALTKYFHSAQPCTTTSTHRGPTWFGWVENFSFAHGIDHQWKGGENRFHTGMFGRDRGQGQEQVDHFRRRRQFVRRCAACECMEQKEVK